jgi:hypothetical protein
MEVQAGALGHGAKRPGILTAWGVVVSEISGPRIEVVVFVRIDRSLRGQAVSALEPLFVFKTAGSLFWDQEEAIFFVDFRR